MKKLICLVLAVLLCMGAAAAEGSPFAKKGISLPGKAGMKPYEPKAETKFLMPEATQAPEVAEPEAAAEGSPFAKKGISLPGKAGVKAPEAQIPEPESVFQSSEADHPQVKKAGPTVPDPKGVFAVDGELYLENVEDSGATYDIYSYYFYMDMEQLADAVIDYGMYLADNYGFQVQKYNMDYALAYYGFFHDSCDMPVELGLYIEEDGDLANGGQGLIQALLSVPDDFDFVPGSYPSDMGKCIDCGGSGRCPHCVGGRSNYGAGYEDCVVCDGTNICNICGGTGET